MLEMDDMDMPQEGMVPDMGGDLKAETAKSLYITFANSYAMQFIAHGMHWNVTGPDFQEMHAFFNMIYSDVDGVTDDLAENLRKLGFKAPCCLEELLDASEVSYEGGTTDPLEMTRALLAINDKVNASVLDTFAKATAANEQGIANFMADRDDKHKKWSWQMKSILGMN